LSIGEQAAMVTFPCIVKHLLSKGVVDDFLVSVDVVLGHVVTCFINDELIMRPKTVVERKVLRPLNLVIYDCCLPILKAVKTD
jgi:hypothetical protein